MSICKRAVALQEGGMELEAPWHCGDPNCQKCYPEANPYEIIRYTLSSRIPKARFAGSGEDRDIWACRYMEDVPRLLGMIERLSAAVLTREEVRRYHRPEEDCPACKEECDQYTDGCKLKRNWSEAQDAALPIAQAAEEANASTK